MKPRNTKFNTRAITGYVETRTKDEIAEKFRRIDKAERLGLIGIIDEQIDTENKQREYDRTIALGYVMRGEPIPEDLLQRILKYKREDEKNKKYD